MSYHFLIPLFAAVASISLGCFVFWKTPPSRLSRVFLFLAFILLLWNLHFFVLYWVEDKQLAFRVARILRIGSIFLGPSIVHLLFSLGAQRAPIWNKLIAFDYVCAGLLTILNFSDLIVSDLRLYPWGYYSVGGPLYGLFTVYLVSNFGVAIYTLLWDYATSTEPRTRLQLKFWLLGAGLALPLGLTNLFPAYGVSFYPLGNLANVAWTGVVAYAIVRHRMMDIQLVVTKGMSYAVASFVLILPVFLGTIWLQKVSFSSIHPDFSFALLTILIAVATLFPLLRQRIEPRIERSWIREKREYRAVIVEFTRNIVKILEQQRLLRELAGTLKDSLGLDRVAVALGDDDCRVFSIRHAVGVPASVTTFRRDESLISCFRRHRGAMLRDELRAGSNTEDHHAIENALDPNGWEVCIPLRGGEQVIGFIALGRKPKLEAFFAEDLELLETLAGEASVALANARLYDELKKSQDIIRRADRSSALGTLAAGIAHEIRNPLVSIQTFFQLAPQRIQDEEFMTEFLGMTANEVKRISHLINELLSFARSPTPSYGPVDLNTLVERVEILISPEAKKQKVRLECVRGTDTPLVYGDGEQMKQVLINLVFNAIQATTHGGLVTIATRGVRRQGSEFGRLEVRDTGCGIAADQLENIFNPFYTTKVKGTGLGLAITQRIVSEHGGVIEVESEKGHGATFFVDLPTSATQPQRLDSDNGDRQEANGTTDTSRAWGSIQGPQSH